MKTLRSAVVVLVAAASTAQAAGFAIDTHSGRATGMAQAVTGLVNDPSALYYNVAGIATGKGLSFQLGDSPILPSVRFTPAGGESVSPLASVSPPPHAFIRYGITEDLAVGFGFTTPFGASSRWPEEWMGRAASTGSMLSVYEFNPALAMSLFDKRVRLGLGLRLMRGTLELHRDVRFTPDQFGSVVIGGLGTGEGYNLGLQVDVAPKFLTLGVSYRSGATLSAEGRAHFENVPAEFASAAFDQGVRTEVTLPQTFRAGLGLHPMDDLTLGLDFAWNGWSSFQSLRFESTETGNALSDTQKAWRDTMSFHLGGEYGLTDVIDVRAGFSFDPTPSPTGTLTPDLPDADRYRVSLGAGYEVNKNVRVDLGYQLVLLKETMSTVPASTGLQGTYGGSAHVFSITAGVAL